MKDQQERAELLAELRMRFPSRVLEWAARLLEEDGREIEKLRSDLFLARDALACVEQQYRNAMDPTFAGIIANPRAEKAEAELARIRKERDAALAMISRLLPGYEQYVEWMIRDGVFFTNEAKALLNEARALSPVDGDPT
jgi:hypothetical protein